MQTIEPISKVIRAIRKAAPPGQAILVAISGIDGSGKGYITEKLVARLREQGEKAVGIGIDGWLNLPPVRFNLRHPAATFYHQAIRFQELFAKLILPLKAERQIYLTASYTEETATAYRPHTYAYDDVDIILLEGVFLLKRELRRHYDLSVWIDCTFATALERAIARNQEGLSPADTIRAYETIYFPAQQLHHTVDNPRAAADLVLQNDLRLMELPPFQKPTGEALVNL